MPDATALAQYYRTLTDQAFDLGKAAYRWLKCWQEN